MYSQTVSQSGRTVHTIMGPPGWQGRLCVGSFLSRVCSGITQRARADAAPALALAPFLGSLVVVGCGAGCRCRCRCRLLAGLAVAVMREDGFELPTCSSSSHRTRPLYPAPLPARCGNQSEGSPLHVRGSVAVLAGESGGTSTAIFRALAILFAPRGTRLIHSLLGPRLGSWTV